MVTSKTTDQVLVIKSAFQLYISSPIKLGNIIKVLFFQLSIPISI